MLHLPTIVTSLQSVSSHEVTLIVARQSAAANLQHNQESNITIISSEVYKIKLGFIRHTVLRRLHVCF